MEKFNFEKVVNSAYEAAIGSRGQVNILVVGKTGTGKSTLVNAIFSGKLAETGQGRPITQHMRRYTKTGSPVSIYDTKGLELTDYSEILIDLTSKVREINRSEKPADHVHVAWLCIAESTRRIEDAEQDLFQTLDSLGIPVIVVITTALSDQGFRSIVRDMFHSARNVVRINSEPYVMDGGVVIPVHGLTSLADLTMDVVPEGQKNAFAAAQRVTIDQKVTRSRVAVGMAATSAFAAGAVPIPFSDTLALVPIQVTMLATISAIFGLDVTVGFLSTLVSGAFGSVAGTMGGRAIVGALLKFVPGVGSIAGGAISGGVAGVITTAFGEAYIAVLRALLTENPDADLGADEIAKAFKEKLKY